MASTPPRRLPRLAARLRAGADTTVVLWGDSLFAREMHTSAGGIDPRFLPPMMHTRRFDWHLWQALPLARPAYRRYDSPDTFAYTGDWQAVAGDPAWDDGPYRPGITYVSNSPAASLSWTLASMPTGVVTRLLYRTEATGADALVEVGGGPGAAEVFDEATGEWVDAHGYRFTQARVRPSTPRRQGNTLFPHALALRARSLHPSPRVTIARSGGGARLLLWGIETYLSAQGVLHLHNAGRGSHTLEMLASTMDDEVIDRHPDLVLLELPLLNMVQATPSVRHAVNWVWDVVWGDRPGAENDWALARRAAGSAMWSAFEVLLLVPHHSRAHLNPDDSPTDLGGGITAHDVYAGVRQLIDRKGDLPVVDMARAFEQAIVSDRRFATLHAALAPSATDGSTYTTDGTHQNDRGTLIYAREVCAALGLPLPAPAPQL